MAEAQFDVNVRQDPRRALAVLDMSGDMNVLAKGALEGAYIEAVTSNPARIVLNFERVEYINSSGIALIVALLSRARAEHRAVTAFGLNSHYVEIFDITSLSDFIKVFSDEQSAALGVVSESPSSPGY